MIIEPHGPDGKLLGEFKNRANLICLPEKTVKLSGKKYNLPPDCIRRRRPINVQRQIMSIETTEGFGLKRNGDIEVLAGQLVAQNMLIQMLLGKSVLTTADAGEELRFSIAKGLEAIQGNPNMTKLEKFGCEKTLVDAIDTIDQIRSKSTCSQ